MVCGTGHWSAVQMVGWRNYSMASARQVCLCYVLFYCFQHLYISCDLCSKEEECTFFSVLKMKCVNMSTTTYFYFMLVLRIQEYKEYKNTKNTKLIDPNPVSGRLGPPKYTANEK